MNRAEVIERLKAGEKIRVWQDSRGLRHARLTSNGQVPMRVFDELRVRGLLDYEKNEEDVLFIASAQLKDTPPTPPTG